MRYASVWNRLRFYGLLWLLLFLVICAVVAYEHWALLSAVLAQHASMLMESVLGTGLILIGIIWMLTGSR